MSRNILVVAAHSDDEALGCGGTMARLVAEGNSVHVLFLTDGVGARVSDDQPTSEATGSTDAAERSTAALAALACLGVPESQVHGFSFPDNALDSQPRLAVTKAVESVVAQVQPEVVFTHHAGDLNIDHRYAYEAVMTACRPQPGSTVRSIYSFEVPSSTGWAGNSFGRSFQPTYFVNIEAYWAQKEQALKAYASEMREFPHARSIQAVRALGEYRGSQMGLPIAEAFVTERMILS